MCSGMLRIGDGRSVWWSFRMGLECVAARLVSFFPLLCLFALCCLLSNCEIGGLISYRIYNNICNTRDRDRFLCLEVGVAVGEH